MSNNKQSSVEWLISQLIEKDLLIIYGKSLEDNDLIEIIKQAKEIEKQNIKDAFIEGDNNGLDYYNPMTNTLTSEQYYNETFNTKE